MKRLTRRFIIKSLDNLNLSNPIRYERYYINDFLRVQKKDNKFEKEVLDKNNYIIDKKIIEEKEFLQIITKAQDKIIRDSYLLLDDANISIKKYLGRFDGLIRVEIKFKTQNEMNYYKIPSWVGKEVTNSPLAFDNLLRKLTEKEFRIELNKYN